MLSNTSREFEIVERIVSVWLINKDGQQRGKITARHTKKATIVAFLLYATTITAFPLRAMKS